MIPVFNFAVTDLILNGTSSFKLQGFHTGIRPDPDHNEGVTEDENTDNGTKYSVHLK